MACGRPPFKASNDYQIFQKILRLDYSFPDGFQDRQLCDLIGKLLVLEPANRLTSAQIKQHPFFTSVDWSTALCQQQPPSLQLGQYKRNNLQQRTSGSSSGGGGGGDGGFEGEISSNSENIEGSGSLDAAESVNSGRISDIALQDEDRWRSYLQSEEIIVHAGVLIKWRKLFPKRRFFILTDRPRLIYINPRTGEQKGVIQLTGREARVQLKDSKNFLIHTPGRTYVLEDPEGEAKYWCETISARLPM
jgi:3-phosphoinositide dependent protein kinase-1